MQIEYDEEWLGGQRFEVDLVGTGGAFVEGTYRISGLNGIGSSSVVFRATDPNGHKIALKFELAPLNLCFYLRELPGRFKTTPPREVRKVVRKLPGLLGDPLVDLLVEEYDLLYSNIVQSLYESGVSALDRIDWENDRSQVLMSFALRTPGVRYRIQDWATGGDADQKKAEWARSALGTIDNIAKTDPDLRPEELLENPFYISGGAIASGLFTDGEFPDAIGFLRDQFGPRAEDSPVDLWLNQCWIIGNLLLDLVDTPAVAQFVQFHNLCSEMLTD